MTQSELELENELILQLNTLGFESAVIHNIDQLEANLKVQLEKFNATTFSELEFARILNHLKKGDRFIKSKTLRDRFLLKRDDETSMYVRFFNMENWCQNEYQVTNQITINGKYENRYDVTLLINGIPLVQIELKKRGIEMKEAYNQIQRYQYDSFRDTLFEYVQIFVISNGVNTKYFSNLKDGFEFTFFWTDENNNKITSLEDFANVFLEKCNLSEMIAEYIVLKESSRTPMILRPYQVYAAKAIENRVKESDKNGYIWHTTGSGKTLTSFKTSQILTKIPEIKKILFVVDRKDLDTQTIKEFRAFSKDSVDGTDNTRALVTQLQDPNIKLIVTTIQKLDRAIKYGNYLPNIEYLKNEKVVIIFDECHRSQFGKTHAAIKRFFQNSQLIGFTGTPIFAENNNGGVTTKDVFDECLHKYIITHAISDNNVLGFAIEYVGRYKQKDQNTLDADIFADELVEGIDTKELLESDDRLQKISEYVLHDWKRKTKNGKFNAIFAVSSIDVLKKYYKFISAKKPEGFRLVTIFTYEANETINDEIIDDNIDFETLKNIDKNSRDFLEICIAEYNREYSTNHSTERFYEYYRDIQDRIKDKQVDLLLVVNMFLTGFDSSWTNTLYVDKNLKYHGLIQAYSRTNRILNADKPHGNIVSFRNLKAATDKALALYGDEDAKEIVFKKPYAEQKIEFQQKIAKLQSIAPDLKTIDDFRSETDKAMFVQAFRNLLRAKSSLETFAEFDFGQFDITEQEFRDYESKYLDIYSSRKENPNKESVLDQIDFELELTVRDIVNFDYIIKLIAGLTSISSDKIREKKTAEILKLFDRDIQLKKKKDLIQKFIEQNLPQLAKNTNIEEAFNQFWSEEKSKNIRQIAQDEVIPLSKLENLFSEYLYTQKIANDQALIDLLPKERQPEIMQRSSVVNRIKNAIVNVIEVFEW